MPVDTPESRTLARASAIARHGVGDADVAALLADVDALDGRALVRFDARSRSHERVDRGAIDRRRLRRSTDAERRLLTLIDLVSVSGHQRERAVGRVELRPGTVALIAVRATDWVEPVRRAALLRLADVPPAQLRLALDVVEILTQEHARGAELEALVERRLDDDELRAATRSARLPTERAAWRRLAARGALTAAELTGPVVGHRDPRVRGLAAGHLTACGPAERRTIAEALLSDPVGGLAARGLETLIALDGDAPIEAALVARSSTLRRRAVSWADVRGIDARALYRERLRRDATDAIALVALAELADADAVLRALDDSRSRVRATALRALVRLDAAGARSEALSEIVRGRTGPVGRAAAAVLRAAPLGDEELTTLERVVDDHAAPSNARLRALALLRRSRWRHLAALLSARRSAEPALAKSLDRELRTWLVQSASVGRAPDETRRARLTDLLPTLEAGDRERIAFILRTAR